MVLATLWKTMPRASKRPKITASVLAATLPPPSAQVFTFKSLHYHCLHFLMFSLGGQVFSIINNHPCHRESTHANTDFLGFNKASPHLRRVILSRVILSRVILSRVTLSRVILICVILWNPDTIHPAPFYPDPDESKSIYIGSLISETSMISSWFMSSLSVSSLSVSLWSVSSKHNPSWILIHLTQVRTCTLAALSPKQAAHIGGLAPNVLVAQLALLMTGHPH